jgi:hypothetical protein
MLVQDFTEYAIKESRDAVKSRHALSADVQKALGEVMWELAERPRGYPERTTTIGRTGQILLYKHPDPAIEVTYEIDEQDKVLYFLHFVAPALPSRKTVFISYSHCDQSWIVEIKKFLTVLEQEGLIKLWDDSLIKAGDRWREAIDAALDSARAAVLLVSQDFLVSKFVTECELPKLLARAHRNGVKIFWIPVSPSTVADTHSWITDYQSPVPNAMTSSLEQLGETERKRVLVEMSRNVAEALSA